ncbi:PE domain-containing protein [Mycobacterium intracellulare]|uniref:PE domain-containing protein n=1 Tax=Mycobacterium intracellulare TaxID=1767 RepID=UPI001E3CAA9A|nr:PE domain-containing protein [Mycobacterium intracellulare]
MRVDPAALAGAAGQAGAVAHAAIPHADQVAPCAPDHVSVATSSRFSAQVSLARRYTAIANSVARRYGVMLQTSAAAYGDQEEAAAATLGSGGGGGTVPVPTPVPAADIDPVVALLSGGGVSTPAGEVPSAPRDIARLIETGRGGVGVQAWQVVERSLRTEAAALEQAAEQLGAAIAATEASWESASAHGATAQLRTLRSWYEGHARYVGGLAQQASTHVGNFHRASNDIPTYRQVVEGERELDTAVRANIAAKGMRREAVVHAQVKVAGLYQASTAGFSSYTFAESVPGPGPGAPIPPPGASPGSPDVQRANGPGGAPVTKPDPSPASAPREPVQQGPGPGESLLSGGPTWPPADVDPAAVGSPLLETVTGAGAGAVPQLLPGILGGVVGGLGGVMGGLAGSGAKALQGVQQAAAPMMSGLGQHPGGGSPSGGESPPETPESLGEPAGADGGGGGGGETAPASDGGAMGAPAPLMGAPAPLMAAPEAAAPAAAASAPAAPAATSAGPAPAVGAMGPMMPPMGGRGGASGGPQNKQLYPDRVLKVVTPPNSEPVKNRYEGRNKDNDRGRDKPRG